VSDPGGSRKTLGVSFVVEQYEPELLARAAEAQQQEPKRRRRLGRGQR